MPYRHLQLLHANGHKRSETMAQWKLTAKYIARDFSYATYLLAMAYITTDQNMLPTRRRHIERQATLLG
jgi:hypothetical protein